MTSVAHHLTIGIEQVVGKCHNVIRTTFCTRRRNDIAIQYGAIIKRVEIIYHSYYFGVRGGIKTYHHTFAIFRSPFTIRILIMEEPILPSSDDLNTMRNDERVVNRIIVVVRDTMFGRTSRRIIIRWFFKRGTTCSVTIQPYFDRPVFIGLVSNVCTGCAFIIA